MKLKKLNILGAVLLSAIFTLCANDGNFNFMLFIGMLFVALIAGRPIDNSNNWLWFTFEEK